MKIKLIWFFGIWVLFHINFVYSDCGPGDPGFPQCAEVDDGKVDYNDPQTYNNVDPYTDMKKDNVNWDAVPEEAMENMPPGWVAEAYDELNDNQRQNMNPEQIEQSIEGEKIGTFNEVNIDNAEIALKKITGVDVNLGNGEAGFEDGKLVTSLDTQATLGEMDLPKGSLVNVRDDGELEVILEDGSVEGGNSQTFEVPNGDSFILSFVDPEVEFNVKLGDEDLALKGTFRVNSKGELELNSRLFDKPEFSINDVRISELSGDKFLRVNFDERYFGDPGVLNIVDSVVSYTKGNKLNFDLSFDGNNNAFFDTTEFASPVFSISSGVEELNIYTRKLEGLVPIVEIELGDDSIYSPLGINNGGVNIDFTKEEALLGIYSSSVGPLTTLDESNPAYMKTFGDSLNRPSSPMRIEISGVDIDSSGTYLMSGYNEVFALNDKNYLPIDDGYESLNGIQTAYSETLSFNNGFTVEMIKQRYGVTVLNSFLDQDGNRVDASKSATKRMFDVLGSLPTPVLESINNVELVPESIWLAREGKDDNKAGYVFAEDSDTMYIKESSKGSLFSDWYVYHEGVHSWDFSEVSDFSEGRVTGRNILDAETNAVGPNWLKRQAYGTWEDAEESPFIELSFNKDWSEVHGEQYGVHTSRSDITSWKKGYTSSITGDISGPDFGCFSAYGCSDIVEDVATSVENIFANPDYYKPLIDPSNPDSRYIQKLALLHRERVIPEHWLEVQMDGVGYDRACIDDVTNGNGYQSDCIQ